MKKIFLLIPLLLHVTIPGFGQDVNLRFYDVERILDLKGYYSKTQTPAFENSRYVGVKGTFIYNMLFLDGDGHRDPDIGLSLNPSINSARFQSDQAEIANTLMQDGFANFTPALFLIAKPDAVSRFRFFASIDGGVKFFRRLKLNLPEPAKNNKFGLFDQWVFGVGTGIDFNKQISLQGKYVRAWHDVTKSTQLYYLTYISPTERLTTFAKYFSVSANIRIANGIYANGEWMGYRGSFHNERIFNIGIAVQIKRDIPEKSSVSSTSFSSGQQSDNLRDIASRRMYLKAELSRISKDISRAHQKFRKKAKKIYEADATLSNKSKSIIKELNEMRKRLRKMRKELKKASTNEKINQWYDRFKSLRDDFMVFDQEFQDAVR